MRYEIILAVVLISSLSSISADDDDTTSQWLRKKNNTSTDDDNENIDLSPSTDETNDKKCVTDNKEPGECVPYYLCDTDNKTIIDDGFTLFDVRQGQCYSYLEVCCAYKPLTDTVSAAKKMETDIPAHRKEALEPISDLIRRTTTPSSDINNDKMTPINTVNDNDVSQCGWDVPELFLFPKNDSAPNSNYGEFPWAVALIKKSRSATWSQNNYLGGGSLIHPSVVLTVAHKVDQLKPEKIKIRAGEWDTQTTLERYPYQERDVKKIIIHPDFFKTSLYFDVALLILESPFNLEGAPHIRTACIGKKLPPPGTACFSMGWGPDFNNEEKYTTKLKKIRVPLVGAADCTAKLQKSRLGPYFRLHNSLTCAGGDEGVDTCQGDGGSSLVCPTETRDKQTRYVVYGVVAYGIDCGKAERPGVYASAPAARAWLAQEMTALRYGTATFTV